MRICYFVSTKSLDISKFERTQSDHNDYEDTKVFLIETKVTKTDH